jgi:sugar-phosphatase
VRDRLARGEAVLFDLDGVLVDSRRCVELVWEAWARGRGIDAAAVLRAAHGRRTSEVLRETLPQLDVAAEVARLDALEAAERRGLEPVPGASELVAALPRSRWAVVTSCSPAIARLRLAVARIPDPPVLVTGADVRRGKPDPGGYLRAARALDADPGRCIVVEDAPAGIAAGRAAGMSVIAVRGTFPEEQLAAADAVIGGVGELRVERTGAGGLTLAWGDAARTPPQAR